jgi:hypothetical protein
MAVALDPSLHIPPRPWHTVELDFLSHLLVTAISFDNVLVAVDHLTQIGHTSPCTNEITKKEIA